MQSDIGAIIGHLVVVAANRNERADISKCKPFSLLLERSCNLNLLIVKFNPGRDWNYNELDVLLTESLQYVFMPFKL
jgi:hypothetical protein